MSDALKRQSWLLRWHVARFLIHLGIAIAPDGPVRDLLLRYLEAFGDEILRAYSQAARPATPTGDSA